MSVCKCVLAYVCMSMHVVLSVCEFMCVGVSLSQHTVTRRLCRKAAASQLQMSQSSSSFFSTLSPLSVSPSAFI